MYAIYRTDGFVLGYRAVGEASRDIVVFTREIGLVRARAQGIRLLHSKLRGHAQLYARGNFSFVRGREAWRLVGASDGEHLRALLGVRHHAFAAAARTFTLLRRLLSGEEPDAELFSIVDGMVGALAALPSGPDDTDDIAAVDGIEYLAIARILRRLGYLAPSALFSPVFESAAWSADVFHGLLARRDEAVQAINESLAASHL